MVLLLLRIRLVCNMLLVDPVQTNVRKQRKTLTQPSRQCIVSSLHLYGSFATTAILFYEMNVTCADGRPVHLMLYGNKKQIRLVCVVVVEILESFNSSDGHISQNILVI